MQHESLVANNRFDTSWNHLSEVDILTMLAILIIGDEQRSRQNMSHASNDPFSGVMAGFGEEQSARQAELSP